MWFLSHVISTESDEWHKERMVILLKVLACRSLLLRGSSTVEEVELKGKEISIELPYCTSHCCLIMLSGETYHATLHFSCQSVRMIKSVVDNIVLMGHTLFLQNTEHDLLSNHIQCYSNPNLLTLTSISNPPWLNYTMLFLCYITFGVSVLSCHFQSKKSYEKELCFFN